MVWIFTARVQKLCSGYLMVSWTCIFYEKSHRIKYDLLALAMLTAVVIVIMVLPS